jgi:hypothetical protein
MRDSAMKIILETRDSGGKVIFQMWDSVERVILEIKDSAGRVIFEMGILQGV